MKCVRPYARRWIEHGTVKTSRIPIILAGSASPHTLKEENVPHISPISIKFTFVVMNSDLENSLIFVYLTETNFNTLKVLVVMCW